MTSKELGSLAVQVALQPLLTLFVFAKVLDSLGIVEADYGDLLLPGLVALSVFFTSLQALAFPLVLEFAVTRDIEDRLLAPLPTSAVAIGKLLVAALQGVVAGVVMFPIGMVILDSAPWRASQAPILMLLLVVGAWIGAGLGLALGTLVPRQHMSRVLGIALTPLMFTGAVQYPWPSLSDIAWFKAVSAVNPLTYFAEGLRGASLDRVPHIPLWICIPLMVAFAVLFSAFGIWGFLRRAIS